MPLGCTIPIVPLNLSTSSPGFSRTTRRDCDGAGLEGPLISSSTGTTIISFIGASWLQQAQDSPRLLIDSVIDRASIT